MPRKSFFFHPILLLSSLITGFIVIFNWSSRHPYLVFFEPKIALLARYALAMSLFFILFTSLRLLIYLLTKGSKNQSFFFQTDLITYLILGPILFKRFFIPGRAEGNQYYLWVFLSWIFLKLVLMIVFFDKKTWSLFPQRIWNLVKKIPKACCYLLESKKVHLLDFLIPFSLYLALQWAFSKNLPKISLITSLCYSLFFLSFWLFFLSLLPRRILKKGSFFFIYLAFLVAILTALDYFSFQLVNLHMNGSLGALFADGFKEIPKVLEGADVKPLYFLLSVFLTITLPIAGTLISKKIPSKTITLSPLLTCLISALSLGTCFYTDHAIQKRLPPSLTSSLITTYPIYPFFMKSKGEQLHFNRPLKTPPTLEEQEWALAHSDTSSCTKHPIFVFVIESFRADYLDEKTAPFLFELQKETPHFDLTASNSNVTHCSLFTIYHGLYPHHWATVRDQKGELPEKESQGSFPLRLLKQAGYQLRAFHSSFFKYFNISEVLFGKDNALLETLFEAKELSPNVAQRDRLVIDEAKKYLGSFDRKTPQYMTLLLDSTHHHYYWPDHFEVPCHPYLKAFNYTNKGGKQLELTKNRYRNAIFYVDSLIKEFCDALKKEGLYDTSMIVITGDHAEEFLEYGHYFHGTDLCLPQSHVPIFYKFPKDFEKKPQAQISSHVDIFPTLFESLQISYPSNILEGHSIFSKPSNYILSFKPQYKKSPYEFYLHNGKEKIEAKFLNSEFIYQSQGIEVSAIKNLKEENKILKEPGAFKAYALSLFKEPLEELFKE